MAVAELEVVVVHAQCRAEQVSHVGGAPAGEVDMVGEAESGFAVCPLDHGAVSAHDPVHVPVGGAVFESHFPKGLDGEGQSRVGFPFAVHLLGHVGGADEQDVGVGVRLLDGQYLLGDEFLGPIHVAAVGARHQVAAVFHDDEPGVHGLVGFRQQL